MMLSIENPKDSPKKILEMVNEFNKAAGYKINIQKYVVLLFTNKELPESEINKTAFKTLSKIKYLGVNLRK